MRSPLSLVSIHSQLLAECTPRIWNNPFGMYNSPFVLFLLHLGPCDPRYYGLWEGSIDYVDLLRNIWSDRNITKTGPIFVIYPLP